MLDIHFYMNISRLKESLRLNPTNKLNRRIVNFLLENCRSFAPVVYNIETTNACNMQCVMCPRTTDMTRKIETMDMCTFKKISDQLKPWSVDEWDTWKKFVESYYNTKEDDVSENNFFLYIIPKVIQLHGYGAPLLDKYIVERVEYLTSKGLLSYFSCNPSNINIEKTKDIFSAGLNYIKYSIESVDDKTHKKIRGDASDFTDSYNKICTILEEKEKNNYKTVVVITMLDLNSENQQEEFERLKDKFNGLDVYVYLKSQDQQWYQEEKHGTNSIHWKEFCQFPWSSMTIKSNGEAVQCVEDYNNEIVLGDAKTESLNSIWHGNKYDNFRKDHFDLTSNIKCIKRCDMKLIGDFLL